MNGKSSFLKKIGKISPLFLLFVSGGLVCSLSSCAWRMVKPLFNIAANNAEWRQTSYLIDCNWRGYWFNDVENPVERYNYYTRKNQPEKAAEYIDFHGNNNHIGIDDSKPSTKQHNLKDKSESMRLFFQIKDDCYDWYNEYNPNIFFSFDVYFRIKHNGFCEKRTIKVKDYDKNKITWDKQELLYTTEPDSNFCLPSNFNLSSVDAISCMNGVYNRYAPTVSSQVIANFNDGSRNTIKAHLTNDFIYWFHLVFQQCQNMLLVNSGIRIWSNISQTDITCTIDGDYDQYTQSFSNFTISFDANGSVHTSLGITMGTAKAHFEYHIGGLVNNDGFDYERGAQILGAYTCNANPVLRTDSIHHPSIYNPDTNKYIPAIDCMYKQVFLTLAPISPYSIQAFNLTINANVAGLITGTLSSGWQYLFFNQSLSTLLEKLNHSNDNNIWHMAYGLFAGNCDIGLSGLSIPSYVFSGCSKLNDDDFVLPTTPNEITQYDLNVSDSSHSFLEPSLKNKLSPNSIDKFNSYHYPLDLPPDQGGCGAQFQSALLGFTAGNAFRCTYDHDGKNYDEQGEDKGQWLSFNSPAIKNFILNQSDDIKQQLSCETTPWTAATPASLLPISDADKNALPDSEKNLITTCKKLPWYRIISTPSDIYHSIGYNDPNNNIFWYNFVINYDPATNKFLHFNIGLNYMFKFTGGNIVGDNVLELDPDDIIFDYNPPS